jgi:hypothetical protein
LLFYAALAGDTDSSSGADSNCDPIHWDSFSFGKLAQPRKIFDGVQHGTIDRSLFTDNANFYFDQQALQDSAARRLSSAAVSECCAALDGTGRREGNGPYAAHTRQRRRRKDGCTLQSGAWRLLRFLRAWKSPAFGPVGRKVLLVCVLVLGKWSLVPRFL